MKKCKKLLCLVLALVMALSLCTVAMAGEADGTTTDTVNKITIDVTNYAYGVQVENMGQDTKMATTTSSNLVSTGTYATADSENGVHTNATPTTSSKLDSDDYFDAASYYLYKKYTVSTDYVFDTDVEVVCTVNGIAATTVNKTVADEGKSVTIVVTLPALVAEPYKVPFTAVTKQGGNVTPGIGNFELEVVSYEAQSELVCSVAGLNYTTSGVATAEKFFAITSDNYSDILDALNIGIIVTQKDNVGAGWDHDNTAWLVQNKSWNDVRNDLGGSSSTESDVYVVVAKKVALTDNGCEEIEGAKWVNVADMTFTNIYTENVTHEHTRRQPTTPATPEAPIASPKTGDMGVALYAAMAVSSVLGMGYVSKKKF